MRELSTAEASAFAKTVAHELDGLAHANSTAEREVCDVTALANLSNGEIPSVVNTAIASLLPAQRDALKVLFAEIDPAAGVDQTNFTSRQRRAAKSLGISYDTFRRRRAGNPSKYDELVAQLAERIIETVAVEDPATIETSAPPNETTSSREPDELVEHSIASLRRWLLAGTAMVVLLGLSIWFITSRVADENPPAPSSEETAEAATSALPDDPPPPADTPEVASGGPNAKDLADDTVPAGITDTKPFDDCRPFDEVGAEDTTLATDAIRTELDRNNDGRCFLHPAAENRGGVFWLELREGPVEAGGALAVKAGTEFSVVLLDQGPWQSYKRIGGGNGGRSPEIAGTPTGEIVPDREGYSLVVDGSAYLFSEAKNSTFYWMPTIGFDAWQDTGGHLGPLGRPTSSIYLAEPGFRIDFEGGFLAQDADGAPVLGDRSDDPFELPPIEQLAGRLISARDGTSWFVDDLGRRWWIPDVATWFCAGSDPNRVLTRVPGYAIHDLVFGGIASCPLPETASSPASGVLEALQFCRSLVSPQASVEHDGGRWNCILDETTSASVEPNTICEWQYGRPMLALEGAEGWRCIEA